MGPRAGLDGRKISSPPGFDPGPSKPYSVAVPTELPGPHIIIIFYYIMGPPSYMRSFVDRNVVMGPMTVFCSRTLPAYIIS